MFYVTDVCIMNGKSYTQGQQWYDGCRQICVCDDGVTGHYTCNQRYVLFLIHGTMPTFSASWKGAF